MWIARDKNGLAFIYVNKPCKAGDKGFWEGYDYYINIPSECFPEVKWEDEEPRELVLKPIKEK